MADYQTYKKINGTNALIDGTVNANKTTGLSTAVVNQNYYYDCCYWSPENGGCCFLWTVPANTQTIKFEIVSGGGSGGPGRCCSSGYNPGGSGAYGIKTLHAYDGDFTPGSSQYTICAAASTRCSCCGCCVGRRGCGFCGCTTYVQGPGLNNFCATGGSWGHHKCGSWCYTCKMQTQCNWCRSEVQGCVCGNWDFALGGINGSDSANQYCNTEHYPQTGAVPGPWGASFVRGRAKCGSGNTVGCCYGHALFPGGGGFTAGTEGSNCWGSFGAGGLVVVTYWS
tara:strand:- start:1280 stop:2125 length:846 start_codon:yes stop_codon:yes gene_type:complete